REAVSRPAGHTRSSRVRSERGSLTDSHRPSSEVISRRCARMNDYFRANREVSAGGWRRDHRLDKLPPAPGRSPSPDARLAGGSVTDADRRGTCYDRDVRTAAPEKGRLAACADVDPRRGVECRCRQFPGSTGQSHLRHLVGRLTYAPVPKAGSRTCPGRQPVEGPAGPERPTGGADGGLSRRDRKSTRLNSSHRTISYAVFCLK